jgi:hypothetical protein
LMLVLSANANPTKDRDGGLPLPVCPPQCPIDGQIGAN